MNLILKRLASVSGFLNASKTANLVREKREFDVQAALIRQTLAAPVLIISETDSFVRFKVKRENQVFFVPKNINWDKK